MPEIASPNSNTNRDSTPESRVRFNFPYLNSHHLPPLLKGSSKAIDYTVGRYSWILARPRQHCTNAKGHGRERRLLFPNRSSHSIPSVPSQKFLGIERAS